MIDGRYFFPHSARFVPARADLVDGKALRISGTDNAVVSEVPFRKVRVSARLGDIPRWFYLPDGGAFETGDNDAVDYLLDDAKRLSGQGWVDILERSWRVVAVSVVLACIAGWAFIEFGIPAAALALANATPPSVSRLLSNQTMDLIDGRYVKPSKLPAKDRAKAQMLFERVAAIEPRGLTGYHLLFRDGGAIGANAFALPDGRIVMTDQLWAKVRDDEEIEGVFAHEMAHVNHAHGLQRVYEASLVPAAIAVVTGDLSQVSQLSVILPGILLQSSYSRSFEQQADDDAAAMLLHLGGHPSRLAEFLERLDAKKCGKSGCGPSWLGSHPETVERAARLRSEDVTPKN